MLFLSSSADSWWSPIGFKLLTQGVGAALPQEWSEEIRCLKVSVQASLTPATGLAYFQSSERVECGPTWNVYSYPPETQQYLLFYHYSIWYIINNNNVNNIFDILFPVKFLEMVFSWKIRLNWLKAQTLLHLSSNRTCSALDDVHWDWIITFFWTFHELFNCRTEFPLSLISSLCERINMSAFLYCEVLSTDGNQD